MYYTMTSRNWQKLLNELATRATGDGSWLRSDSAISLGSRNGGRVHFGQAPKYLIVQCPSCKTMETLQFIGDTLAPSRKFSQKGGYVYHDCGSDQPCRLHGRQI